MTTWILTVDLPEALATLAADRLAEDPRLGADAAGAFDLGRGGWRLEAYYSTRPDLPELTTRLRAALIHRVSGSTAGLDAGLAAAALRPFDGADWSAIGLDALPPVVAGRFRVFGEHNRPDDRRRTDLVIEAATAFGTGDHASTWLALSHLDAILKRSRPVNVLDVGTGTGILGLALSRARPGTPVLASDIEPVAVRMAAQNRLGNAVGPTFRALLADGLADRRFAAAGPYDLVLANILPDPLTRLASPIVALMAPGARLVVAGLRIGEEPRLVAAYRARGLVLERRLAAKEWSSLLFRRPAAHRPRWTAATGSGM